MCKRHSDSDIIEGFRRGDSDIISTYFYGYCRVGYSLFDRRYQLSEKANLDFMSLAHQYALYLLAHDWKPLENHFVDVSFKTWFINGFRFVVLDALKWYRKEYGSIKFEEYLQMFDMTSDLRLHFNDMVKNLCYHVHLQRQDRIIIDLMLLRGLKGKEVAAQMGMTASAISQRYKKLRKQVIDPYFKENFDMNFDAPEVIDERALLYGEITEDITYSHSRVNNNYLNIECMSTKRTTPDIITKLEPNEIFVFGSNLKGMHGGGAAYVAYSKFGAIMGQGVGLQGQSYGIPTMQGGVETIRPYVDEFIQFAKDNKEKTFLVTRIGCGIAGFTDEEIAPLFAQAHEVENIILPAGW